MNFYIYEEPNLFSRKLCILFPLNILISICCLFCFLPAVKGESYSENFGDLHIDKEEAESLNDRYRDGLKEVGILSAELVGGCTLNLASFLISVSALSMAGDDPQLPGLIMSTALAPLISSFGVTGMGYLFRDEGSWAGSLIGAYVPVLTGVFIASQIRHSSGDALVSIFIGSQRSPIGAVVGYNIGRPLEKYKWLNYVLSAGIVIYLCFLFSTF